MIINVGSKNPNKVNAVREILMDYSMFKGAKVIGVNADSGVYKQPMSLGETRIGARNRAINSFDKCDYSLGIESGLMSSMHPLKKYFNICVCNIYDGHGFYEGLSSGFEYPKEVIKEVLENKLEINEAVFKLGLTKKTKIGSKEGIISLFTNGRTNRKEYTEEAIRNALIKIEFPKFK